MRSTSGGAGFRSPEQRFIDAPASDEPVESTPGLHVTAPVARPVTSAVVPAATPRTTPTVLAGELRLADALPDSSEPRLEPPGAPGLCGSVDMSPKSGAGAGGVASWMCGPCPPVHAVTRTRADTRAMATRERMDTRDAVKR